MRKCTSVCYTTQSDIVDNPHKVIKAFIYFNHRSASVKYNLSVELLGTDMEDYGFSRQMAFY